MTLITLPCIPSTEWRPPELVGATRNAGRSASGIVVGSRADGGGLWRVSFNAVIGRDKDRARTLHAVKAFLAEGVRPIVVPLYRERLQPWPTLDGELVTSYYPLPHLDESLFSDDTGYYQPVIIVAADAAALRATSLQLTKTFCGDLRGGEIFSIDHPVLRHRLYRVQFITEQDDASATITIEPPLREALEDATSLEFDIPKCVMQLDGQDAFPISARHPSVISASMAFVESFLPLDV